ncbi:MAG TPA: GldM family protein [Bacteroidales bacterium]|nr:GldM family protein [Bacteroidales bacterium]HSA43907.1 GldM family protein [Bacteroidales bacterium]
MMYLVLTALLALNVSVEILNAFIIVNRSIENTNKSVAGKVEWIMDKFKQQYALNQNKVGPHWEKAQHAQQLAQNMINYIENLKLKVVMVSEGVDSLKAVQKFYQVEYRQHPTNPKDSIPVLTLQLHEVPTRDKYDESTHFFIGSSQDGSAGKARELKNRIIDFKKNMLNLVTEGSRANFKMGLDTDGPFYDADRRKQNWEMHHFYHTILAADVTILNKLINEVQTTVFDVVNHLFASISETDFKFDKIAARVVPQTRYIFQGDEYNAEIFVAAYDTKTNPEVYIVEGADTVTDANLKGAKQIEGVNGLVSLKIPAGGEGIKKYAGVIMVKTPTGEINKHYFNDEYVVARPSLTVSATKMNVFYIGVDNPVSISVPGVPTEKVRPTITVGSLNRDATGKDWIVRVPREASGQKTTISVSAGDGKDTKSMGGVEFRVKRVPDPVPFMGRINSGPIAREELLISSVIPRMPQDFDFELNFLIQSFTFVSTASGDIYQRNINGNQLTEEVKKFIRTARRGQKIWVENIVAQGPDGNRRLATMSLEIK